MNLKSQQVTRTTDAKRAATKSGVSTRVGGFAGNHTMLKKITDETSRRNEQNEGSVFAAESSSRASFTFQTFIPDKYVPGTLALGYGDSRGFGKPGDSYRTFQQIVVETNESLNESGTVEEAKADTGFSKTAITSISGHASASSLHMFAKRHDANSVNVVFFGSIKSGAKLGSLLEAIDFKGWVNIRYSGGQPKYLFSVSHDAFPAYEAFINGSPIYRWSYPATATVDDLKGHGTAINEARKTGDAPGGTIGPRAQVLLQELKRDVYPKGQLYTVKPGDTLSKIAQENLGAASRWREIYDENRGVIGDETHALEPGMQLVVHKPVDIHSFEEALFHATDPQGGLMRIKGEALTYVRNHETTKKFRKEFEEDLKNKVQGYVTSGSSTGSDSGVFTHLVSYGAFEDPIYQWVTLGTWLLGHCYPEVRYTVWWTGNSVAGWTAKWKAIWMINDNYDLVGGSDKIGLYNFVSIFATLGWHDIVGGRKNAPIQATWEDAGSVRIAPTSFNLKPFVLPAFTTPSDQYSGIGSMTKQRYGIKDTNLPESGSTKMPNSLNAGVAAPTRTKTPASRTKISKASKTVSTLTAPVSLGQAAAGVRVLGTGGGKGTTKDQLKAQISAGKITFDSTKFKKDLLGENTEGAKVTGLLQELVLNLSTRANIRISSVVRSAGHHGTGRAVDIGNETIAGALLPAIATDATVSELGIDELIFDATVAGKNDRNEWNYDLGKKHNYNKETLDDHKDHIHFAVKAG